MLLQDSRLVCSGGSNATRRGVEIPCCASSPVQRYAELEREIPAVLVVMDEDAGDGMEMYLLVTVAVVAAVVVVRGCSAAD